MASDSQITGARRAMIRLAFRPLLVQGSTCQVPDGLLILIDSEQSRTEQAISIWHETLHLLLLASGSSHDEAAIEVMARRLAATCPEIVEMCGGRACESPAAEERAACLAILEELARRPNACTCGQMGACELCLAIVAIRNRGQR